MHAQREGQMWQPAVHLVGPRLVGACICIQAGQLHLGICKRRVCSLQVCFQPGSLSLALLNLPSQGLHLHHRSHRFGVSWLLFREHQQSIGWSFAGLQAG